MNMKDDRVPEMSRRNMLKGLGAGAAILGMGSMLRADTDASSDGPAESEIGFRDGNYVLPPLPYAYDALEPYIDEQTMRLHHDVHHAGYVRGANRAVEKLQSIATGDGDRPYSKHWARELAFHGSGHAMHVLFWNCMAHDGGGVAKGDLAKAIRLMASGLLDVEAVISHRFALGEIHQAIEVMGSPERNKVIIHP